MAIMEEKMASMKWYRRKKKISQSEENVVLKIWRKS
jgi:hypothetical protein